MAVMKKDIRTALKGSLIMEEQAIKDRFEKAETVLQNRKGSVESPEIGKTESQAKQTTANLSLHEPTEGPPVMSAQVAAKSTAQLLTEQTAKVIRDSFTMPQSDYNLLSQLKKRALRNGQEITKSELLRAGIQTLETMTDEKFLVRLSKVQKLKTGRPKR